MRSESGLWVFVSIDEQETRVSSARPPATTVAECERVYVNNSFPTLTDVLLRYQQDTGITLHGAQCGVSMAGACFGESLAIERVRWTVSRPGLNAVFGSAPTIMNRIAAKSWAITEDTSRLEHVHAAGKPDFTQPGTWAVCNIDVGVGTALISVDTDGLVGVTSGEAGHAGFAPATDVERRLLAAMAERTPHVSWEQVLKLSDTDDVWNRIGITLTREERANIICGCAGSFVGSVVVNYGSWNGAIMIGARASNILKAGSLCRFNEAFESKHFKRLLKAAPRWLLERPATPTTGMLAMMRAAHRLVNDANPTLHATSWSRRVA